MVERSLGVRKVPGPIPGTPISKTRRNAGFFMFWQNML